MHLSGSPFDYLVAFGGGILLSLTPCIYPLIPISIGYIGIRAGGSRTRGFALSFCYVSGLAVTYAILGVIACLTGTMFGRINSLPLTQIAVGLIIVFFGLAMLEIFSFSLPDISRFSRFKKRNYLSAFFLGLSSGLIASPCLTPVLGSILLYLTTTKNLIYGATLLLSFAYGMGLVLLLAGTFSGILIHLPSGGRWMDYIKKICAFLLLVMGIYFIFCGIRRF